jgi:uncharacterized protein
VTIENEFTVDAPIEQVWPLLNDIPNVATCIPNASVTEIVDDATYKAQVGVKAGPVSVSYKATIIVVERDDTDHRAVMKISGDDVKGRGGVKATVSSEAHQLDGKTRVTIRTDAQISGVIASIGGRMIEGIARKTVADFASNLQQKL